MAFLRGQENVPRGTGGSPALEGNPDVLLAMMRRLQGQGHQVAQLSNYYNGGRMGQINDATREPEAQTQVAPQTGAVPGKAVPSTAELIQRIDRLKAQADAAQRVGQKVEKAIIPVDPITVKTPDGEELRYKNRKTGEVYLHDPND